ncbi:MAG TPA: hybrid sensor histidine kinase/response regulator, partial [Myxococcales bacterium]|nr:hybrid sensor histidine kinase/response regulator [Myxococcales bacterium]
LLDDLLDVSRVTQDKIELQRERLDLREVVTGASETLRKRADDARVQLHLALPDAPLHVDGDRTRLRQVVTNLVTNALKYNEPGGNVWIAAATEGATVTLRVRDDGLGMEPQMLERIFDMFVQGDGSLERSDGGMGLGLALVERLVIGHGGAVHARSDGPGSGSELVVQLP